MTCPLLEFGVLFKYWRTSEIWRQLHWRIEAALVLAYLGEADVSEVMEMGVPFGSLAAL